MDGDPLAEPHLLSDPAASGWSCSEASPSRVRSSPTRLLTATRPPTPAGRGSLLRHRYAFAWAYLACYLVANLVFVLLNPHAQAGLIAWASTNVANLEHEPVGPLLLSALVTPGYFVVWPVLIALAVFGANRALGNARTALVCLAGHVIGSLVSEGIVAYRMDAGQLSAANRYITDVGPSYVVVSAIVIALACGTWLARMLAAVDLVVLVFPGHIFSGLSQLDVSAVGHLTAVLTAAVATALILTRRPGDQVRAPDHAQEATWPTAMPIR